MLVLVAAVSASTRGELLPIRSYTTAEGLAANSINKIAVDSRGFVWFSTPEGLSRFDGHRMVNFGVAEGLPHRSVNALLETGSGEYLVGTARGLCQFRPEGGGKFTTYLPGHNRSENNVTALIEDSGGRIWCGTGAGLFEMQRGHSFRRQKLPAPGYGWDQTFVTDVLEDARGKVWLATAVGIYVVGKDGSVAHIGKEDGLPNEWVETLLRDKQGDLWAGTRGGLALLRDSGKPTGCGVQRLYTRIGGVVLDVKALAEGADGAIWAGTLAGLVHLPHGDRPAGLRLLTSAQGLIANTVQALAADRAGNIWAGTQGAGAMKIQPAGFTTFREGDGLGSDRVAAVLADRTGAVLAVTDAPNGKHAVNVFDGAGFRGVVPKVFGDRATWGRNQILLQSRSGEWWMATQVGLCRFPPTGVADLSGTQPKACYAPDTQIFRVFEDAQGRIWASAQSRLGDRLMRWDPATNAISSFDQAAQGLVSTFAEDRKGAVWMGFWGGDVQRYEGAQFTRFKPRDGVPAGAIYAVLVDSAGRLWIGSNSGGLGLVENPGGSQFRVKAYDTTNGPPVERLASNTIYSIVEDKAGRIYAGTAKSVDRLDPGTGHVKHFTAADGLAHGELRSALRDASGSLWFATTQGLSRLSPTADPPPAIPSIRIMDLRIGRDRYPVSQVGETRILRGDLQPSQNQFQVEFVGFNDEPEDSLSYTYKLEGGDSDWQAPGRDHQANYPGLTPGSYRFLVKAVNSEGQTSTDPAEIDFTVLPTIPGRWWFRTLAAILAGAMIYLLYRYRLARLLEMERLRTRIATDLHDDIGSSLSQIAILSEVTSQRVAPEQQAELADIANLSRELVDSMSEIVWAIDPSQDRLDDLVHRMRRFASDLFTPGSVRFHLQAPGAERQDPEMGAGIRRQIFLIFKEALHNIARHSGCTEVEIGFHSEKGWLSLSVVDNGEGFNMAQAHPGHGLASMKQRAQQLGGHLTVDTAPGRGTAIRLRVPIGQQLIGRRRKTYTNG